jgi:GDP-4-dehydro-6-deoxy-D-mannose reductase
MDTARMHVLITGITGFIGVHLARRLRAAGCRVSGLSSDPATRLPGVDAQVFPHVDILDGAALAHVISRCDPQVVVHLAGLSHVGESWKRPGDYLRVNFGGTRNVLRAAAARRVIVASSSEVYGPVPEAEQPIREDRPLDPRSPYAMTKACAEQLALDAGALVVRSFNAVGAGQARHFALPSFAAQLAAIGQGEAEPVIEVGDLSPRRDFLHADDVAAGYQTLLEHGAGLASGEDHSIGEALERLRAISGVAAEVKRDPSRERPVDLPRLCGDAGRLRALGWRPERGLDEALRDLWQEARAACAEKKRSAS